MHSVFIPVSYTHLDVYKRQVYYSEKSDIDTVYTSGKINNYVNDFQATEVLTGAKTIRLSLLFSTTPML